jgi:DNA-binding MarR family transcriptional regulator
MTILKDVDFNLYKLLREATEIVEEAREIELKNYGVSVVEVRALTVIHDIGNKTTAAEMSRHMLRRQNTVAALLIRMKRKKLITRERDKKRRNVWRVSLTPKGEIIYDKSIIRATLHEAFSTLSETEKQQLSSYLEQIHEVALKWVFWSKVDHPFREKRPPLDKAAPENTMT